jgi:hypothetical protein
LIFPHYAVPFLLLWVLCHVHIFSSQPCGPYLDTLKLYFPLGWSRVPQPHRTTENSIRVVLYILICTYLNKRQEYEMLSREWKKAPRSTDVWRYLGRIWELRRGNIRCICK